jgi:dihydrofolate reductase
MDNLRAIVAVDERGVIGCHGRIPWHIREEMALFRSYTLGHTIIMGRKTFESIGHPLRERKNWVITRNPQILHAYLPENTENTENDLRIFSSIESLLDDIRLSSSSPKKLFWVIGGAEIYHQLLPYCSELILSKINGPYEGDAFFSIPPYFSRKEIVFTHTQFTTYRWQRDG